MPIPLLGKIRRVLEEASLATDFDRGVEVEWKLVHGCAGFPHFSLDERVEPRPIAGLGIAIEQEGGVVWIGQAARMQLLQVCCEVLYPLSVEELESVEPELHRRWSHLPDHVGRLQEAKSFDKLRHGPIIISLGVKIVTISPMYLGNACLADPLGLGETNRQREQVPFVQYVELCGRRVFV